MSDLQPSPAEPFSESSLIGIEDLLTPDRNPDAPREGLPRTFRMRADKHYVEMLDAPPVRPRMEMLAIDTIEVAGGGAAASPELVESIARHGVLQPLLVQSRQGRYRLLAGRKRLAAAVAGGLSEVPAIIRHADDESAEAIAAATNLFVEESNHAHDPAETIGVQASGELARSLAALGACVNLLGNPAPVLTQTVATVLVRAEVWRAACLLQASRVLRGEISPARRGVDARSIVERVLQSMEPERQLRGVVIERTNRTASSIDVDEDLVVCALSGLLMAMFALTGGHGQPRVAVSAESQPGGSVVFRLSQSVAGAPLEWATHAGESENVSVEAGGLTTVAIVAARRIVAACDGRMKVEAGVNGTAIQITIPALPYSAV